jgi:Flp pilus assembly protein CpaB
MKRGPKLAVAIALGLLAALFGLVYLSSEKTRLIGSTEAVEVYVAAADIRANTPIDPRKLTKRRIPKTFLQPGYISTLEVNDPSKVTGVAIVPIMENEQIVRTKLWQGKTPPLSDDLRLHPGLVAVSVLMRDPPQALQGLVQARDHVDVLALLEFVKPDNKTKFKEVRPLFYNVEVLAVNRTTESSTAQNLPVAAKEERPEDVQTVTLAVPPAVAQQLILAQQLPSAKIWLVLRSPASGSYAYEVWNTDRLIQSDSRLWDAEESTREMQQDMMKKLTGR